MRSKKSITAEKRHSSQCPICKSDLRSEIEEKFVNCESPYTLEEDYPGISRHSIWNHCKFFKLYEKRSDNIEVICDKIISRGMRLLGNMDVKDMGTLKAAELKAKLSGKLKQNGDLNVNVGIQIEQLAAERKKNMAQGLDAFGIKVESNRLTEKESE